MAKIIIAGDFCPRERVQEHIEAQNFEIIFGEIKKYTSKADYSIVNLEAPIVKGAANPISKCGPSLKAIPATTDAILYAGFNMVTLANNHFYDYGDKGVSDTVNACKEAGIDTVGGDVNIIEASKTFYKEIKGDVYAFINCCEHEFSIATDTQGGSNPINPIKQFYAIKAAKEKAKWVIVIVHGGHEHYNLPSPRMKETYRFFIDAGADAVINHHQHCYSGYEVYNSKPIFYGLGNFCFDRIKRRNSKWNTGYIVELELNVNAISFRTIPYMQADKEPGVIVLKEQCDIDAFEKDIKELNATISNDTLLKQKHEEFMEKTKKYFLSIAEPYTNRYMRALYIRGFLPSKMSKQRQAMLLNHIMCEAHQERFIYALKNK